MFNPAGFLTFGALASFMLKSSVVLTLALAAAAILRRKPAALRHFVLSVFLIGLLFLPILSFVPGGWQTGLLPRGRAVSVYPASLPDQRIILTRASAPDLLEIAEPAPSRTSAIDAGPGPSPGEDITAVGRLPVRSPANPGRLISSLFVGVWAAGILIILLRLGLGLAGAARLTRNGRLLTEPAWRILLARFLAAVSLRRDVRLKSHDAVAIPLTWGLVRPVILLPRGAEEWTEEERATVLCHELSHVKRGDFLVMLLVRLSLAVAWANPLTSVVFGMLRREQEKACDEMVLRTGLKPSVYAAHLLSFRRGAGRRFQPAAAFLGLFGRSPLNERLAAILKHKLVFREVKMKTKLALGCAIILSVALIGTARPAAPIAIREFPSVAAEPAAFDQATVASPAREAQAQPAPSAAQAATPAAQEEKEKAKAKAEAEASKPDVGKPVAEKKIVITPVADKKARVEIVITEGDAVKTLVADEPVVIIKRASPEREILISSGGKEFAVGRSGDVRIEIKADGLTLLKKGDHLDIADDRVLTLKTGKPDVLFITESKKKPQAGEITWVAVEPDDQAADRLVYVTEDEGLEKKLEEIRAQLRQVKENKLALEEVEKSLDALTKSVKKHPRSHSFTGRAIKVGEPVSKSFTIVTDKEPASTKAEKLARAKWAESASVIVSSEEKDGLTLVLTTHPGKIGRERYDRTVDELKQALPEGATLESEFKEDSGAVVVTVKGPKLDKDKTDDLLEKLIPILRKAEKEEPEAGK